jgi:hypothetical protein
MWENVPEVMRKAGELKLKVGDLVRMNPHAMLNGGGLALITKVYTDKKLKGMHDICYLKNGYEVMADDMIDILEVASRAQNSDKKG